MQENSRDNYAANNGMAIVLAHTASRKCHSVLQHFKLDFASILQVFNDVGAAKCNTGRVDASTVMNKGSGENTSLRQRQ